MIYQGDSYSFTLSLSRESTTVLSISAAAVSGGNTVYTYTLKSGPALELDTKITVSSMAHSANNGTFTITDLGTGTFTVAHVGSTQTESGTGTVGTAPNVTTPPVIQIIKLSDMSAVLGSPASMTALDGTNQLWSYTWSIGSTASSDYMAIVSYAADGKTFAGKPIEKIRLGDTNILGVVALDSTVAKNATVAKDSTVAKSSDLVAINPNTSSTILSIKTKTDNLPTDPAGMTLLSSTIQKIVDVYDFFLGATSDVDKSTNPAVWTLKRVDNSVLAQFQLTSSPTHETKTKI